MYVLYIIIYIYCSADAPVKREITQKTTREDLRDLRSSDTVLVMGNCGPARLVFFSHNTTLRAA